MSATTRDMTFWEHVGELRTRILWSAVGLVLGVIVAFAFWRLLYALLLVPLQGAQPGIELHFLSPQEPFVISVRLGLVGGIILASPWILLQAWLFIAPALRSHEKRAVAPVLPVVLSLFLAGVAFVYFVLLPVSLNFLINYAPDAAAPMLTQDRYFGFVTALLLAGGLLFQLPAVLAVLGWLGLVTAPWLWKNSGWALIVLMVLAAIITPTGDAFNMLVLTAPLLLLYILGTAIVWLIQRRARGKVKPGSN